MRSICLALATLSLFSSGSIAAPATAAATVGAKEIPAELAPLVAAALERAGDNRAELLKAFEASKPDQAAGLAFLVAHMPERDLTSLTADFLIENLEQAYIARETMPWGKSIPEELFLNDVLPYASINERRDRWRKDFYEKFSPLVKDCATPAEAAQVLNRDMWKIVDVRYHASKRPKPDQSPYESMEAKFASCSGLSVLLIDACRAVGVPARFAGTPLWADKRGNHSWVEVWDGEAWKFTGACEYNPGGLNQTWFGGKAAQASSEDWRHAIYATTWKKPEGARPFPLVWDLKIDYVNAVDVTDRYAPKAEPGPKHAVGIDVFTRPGGERIATPIKILRDGEAVAEGTTHGSDKDTNDLLEVELEPGDNYQIQITRPGAEPILKPFKSSGKANQRLEFFLSSPTAAKLESWLPIRESEIKEYTARRAGGAIKVDGKLDEAAWQAATFSPRFVDIISGKPTRFDTRAAVLWDDDFLYIGFRIEEPDVQAKLTERDAPIYTENDVEFFIAGAGGYYEFETNALGTLYEAFFVWESDYESGGFASDPSFRREGITKQQGVIEFNGVGFTEHPRGKRIGFMKWDFPGLQSAVHVDGTLNDASDTDAGWTLEVAIPWDSAGMKAIARADKRALPPAAGDTWRMDFSRFNKNKFGDDDSGGWVWSRHGVWDSHIPECFVKVKFSSEPVR